MAEVSNERFNEWIVEHINTANSHLPESNPGVAGAALMQAAARFNCFVSSTQFVSGRVMTQNKDAHIDHYVKLYREYLESHYQDYTDNFAAYSPPVLGISKT
ncbi:DUF3144 domain-containing protein [Asticcacaulis sp. YBE204]|uniref:DUF3144 domain-containing protein n=1 Tax=Asticcacaulis sp. YBE204 TaxID=1282363 RepID=UPI0003C3ED48|nr:DUF3144 domain-containing protein [Asticcacaulis sp. YBE204]ESQ77802.1 hypothetical protein AEYBE204_16870 [Asticcacaulis sp. YBE204]